MKTPLIGVIGGMGTLATAAFYEKLHSLQKVTVEQEYIDAIIYSKPSIPDRTEFILGRSKESPLSALVKAAKTLETAGATILVLPCMTSHYFYNDLVRKVRVEMINFPAEVAKAARAKNVKKVGLLATEGAIKSKILQGEFEAVGIETVVPEIKTQAEVTKIIYDVKTGKQTTNLLPVSITQELTEKGAQVIVLGCTELCINSEEHSASEDTNAEGTGAEGTSTEVTSYINTLDLLARATLRECNWS